MQPREFYVWVEKYRPQTLDDCILPTALKQSLRGILEKQDTPNLLLCGKAGTGKTTVARCLAADLQMDVLMINASDENGIDVLRSKLKDFASSMSFEGKRKMIILDEADYLHPASTQPALRAFMEEFSSTTCFILTCNHPNRIIAPLHSRCSVVDFSVPKGDRASVMTQFAKRAFQILDLEGVTYDKQLVMEVLRVYFPDFRRVLNEMQRFSGGNEREVLSQLSDKDVTELFTSLAGRDFNQLRKWIAQHDDMNESAFYRMLSEQLPARVTSADLPESILKIADYSYRVAFAADKSLNMLACLVDIMLGVQVKA